MTKILTNITGTVADSFSIKDINLQTSSGSLRLINESGSLIPLLVSNLDRDNSSEYNTINFFGLKSFLPLIEFSFSGDAPPTPGDNLGKFGFCHTSGSVFGNNVVVYDNGESLVKIYSEIIRGIVTTFEIVGETSLKADSIYIRTGDSYVLKGGAVSGTIFDIQHIPYTYQNTTITMSSSVKVKYITRITNVVEETFNEPDANLEIFFNSGSLVKSDPFDLNYVAQYVYDSLWSINDEGYFSININASGSIQGSGSIYIQYTIIN